jgi:hypothetical protein
MVDVTQFIRNLRMADRHQHFGLSVKRGQIVAMVRGKIVPDRLLPPTVRAAFLERQLHVAKLEARIAHVAAYETKTKPEMAGIDAKSLFHAALSQTGAVRPQGAAFKSETDKCQDEFKAKYRELSDHGVDLMIEYGAADVVKAEVDVQDLLRNYNKQLQSMGSSPEAGLAQRDFLFSDRPWSDVAKTAPRFAAQAEAERKALVDARPSPWTDRSFLSDSKIVQDLKSRTTPLSVTRAVDAKLTLAVMLNRPHHHPVVDVPYQASMTLAQLKKLVDPDTVEKDDDIRWFGWNGKMCLDDSVTLQKLGVPPFAQITLTLAPNRAAVIAKLKRQGLIKPGTFLASKPAALAVETDAKKGVKRKGASTKDGSGKRIKCR